MNTKRTKEDFDTWYLENNGDPWGYNTKYVLDRLKNSISFIKRGVTSYFNGTFVEFGSFEGSFTTLIASHFPNSRIISTEISEVATKQNILKNGCNENIEFITSDMLSFNFSEKYTNKIILLLECLYYLNKIERELMIEKIAETDAKIIFISAPMIGGKYFYENSLKKLLASHKFRLTDYLVLNFRGYFNLLSPKVKSFLCYNSMIRKKYGNQIIYKFEKL